MFLTFLKVELGGLKITSIGTQGTVSLAGREGRVVFLPKLFSQFGILGDLCLDLNLQFLDLVDQLQVIHLYLYLYLEARAVTGWVAANLRPRELVQNELESLGQAFKFFKLTFPGISQRLLGLLDLHIPPMGLDMLPLAIVILPENHQGDHQQRGARDCEGDIQG